MAIPPTVKNEALWRSRCRKMRVLAQQIVAGKVDPVIGAQQMQVYQVWLEIKADEDFRLFATVADDAHNLTGAAEMAELADFYRAQVIESAARLNEKYRGS